MTITAFPLCWPHGKPRRPSGTREFGRFGKAATGSNYRYKAEVSVADACQRLQAELDRIGARDVVLSTNLRTRLDGLPRSDQPAPTDPGVALYFALKGKPHCLPCDTYRKVEHNICALAAHIEATRAIERYGVADLAAMFTGFQALPSPDTASAPAWRDVLWPGASPVQPTLDDAKLAYRRRAKETHPDHGGSADAFNLVQAAWAIAQQEIRA